MLFSDLRVVGAGVQAVMTKAPKEKQARVILLSVPASAQIYTAPSLDGGDDEYKKLISGKVDNNKPSFA